MRNNLRVPSLKGKSINEMHRWFQTLYVDGLLFNPDDRPEDIVVVGTFEPTFTEIECQVLNESLDRLFAYHGDKVYDVARKYFYKAAGIAPDYTSV